MQDPELGRDIVIHSHWLKYNCGADIKEQQRIDEARPFDYQE